MTPRWPWCVCTERIIFGPNRFVERDFGARAAGAIKRAETGG